MRAAIHLQTHITNHRIAHARTSTPRDPIREARRRPGTILLIFGCLPSVFSPLKTFS